MSNDIVFLFRDFRRRGKVLNVPAKTKREHLIVRPKLHKLTGKRVRTSTIMVRKSPTDRLRGLVRIGPVTLQAALGRGGITAFKREGDGGTPLAKMAVLSGFRRGGMLTPDRAGIALRRVNDNDGWCDAPNHADYNRHVRLPFAASHETLIRNDSLYDFGFVLDWNIVSRRRGAGSAIFLHIAKPGFPPTQGCIALQRRDMLRLMPFLKRGTVIGVE